MQNDVRERRLARELSQAELAYAVRVSRQTINSIETGKYVPSLPLALALARFFGVPVEEMFDARWLDRSGSCRCSRSRSGSSCSPRSGSEAIPAAVSARSRSWSAFGALILLGGRSETIRGLRGDGRDERFRQIDMVATAIAGIVVISAIIIAFVVEVARGQAAHRTPGSARSRASPISWRSSSCACAARPP